MKIKIFLLGLCSFVCCIMTITAQVTDVKHPGVLFNIEDLERMKKMRFVEPWKTGYEELCKKAHKISAPDYKPGEGCVEVGRSPYVNNATYRIEMEAALMQAIQWYVTNDERYARNAMTIIRNWSIKHKIWIGADVRLEVGPGAKNLAAAAEIMRYTYSGWTEMDTYNAIKYFKEVCWPCLGGTKDGKLPYLSPANQAAMELTGALAIAIFCDEAVWLNNAVQALREHPSGGIKHNSLSNGQVSDFGRDQGHARGQIGDYILCAEIALKQGIDIYSDMQNRLGTCAEYYAKTNLGYPEVYIPAGCVYDYFPTPYCAFNVRAIALEKPNIRQDFLRALELCNGFYGEKAKKDYPYIQEYRSKLKVGAETFLFHKPENYSPKITVPLLPLKEYYPLLYMAELNVTEIAVDTNLQPAALRADKEGIWTLSGAGSDTQLDMGNYAWTDMKGDGALVVRVTSLDETNPEAYAGLMIRESLSQDARMAMVWMKSDKWQIGFGRREIEAGEIIRIFRENGFFAPFWLKLERRGNELSGYLSPDGIVWTCCGYGYVDMPEVVKVGIFSTSGKEGVVSFASFDNLGIGDNEKKPVQKKIQVVDFLNKRHFGAISLEQGDVELAKSSSGLPVNYKIMNPRIAKVVDGKIRPLRAGTTRIWAYQEGNEEYGATGRVSWELEVKNKYLIKNELEEGFYFIKWNNNYIDFVDTDWNDVYLANDSIHPYPEFVRVFQNEEVKHRERQIWYVKKILVDKNEGLYRYKIISVTDKRYIDEQGNMTENKFANQHAVNIYYSKPRDAYAIQAGTKEGLYWKTFGDFYSGHREFRVNGRNVGYPEVFPFLFLKLSDCDLQKYNIDKNINYDK